MKSAGFIKFVLLGIAVILIGTALIKTGLENTQSAWASVQKKHPKTHHKHLFDEVEFTDGPSVTRSCLKCHEEAAREVMKTSHWTWLGETVEVPGHTGPVRIGKKNVINNFCIGIEGNWPKCTQCHVGYGWKDEKYDFKKEDNVDCLICHDQSGGYAKGLSGFPVETIDLFEAAKSVGRPTRDNCGWCHFNGGGGDAVKRGDLDGSLSKPVERIDVHMGRYDFQCIDCHRTQNHRIKGGMMAVRVKDIVEVKCTDCHSPDPHDNDRLNAHMDAVACQTCHLPFMAAKVPTKIAWDWSTAGQDVEEEDPHKYLKMKGSFVYARQVVPEYFWFNGRSHRYLKGDPIDPETVTALNLPMGDIGDPHARIWPFKIHFGKQPYDVRNGYLLIPKTVGEGGFWKEFDWHKAVQLNVEFTGLPFSGDLGFAETEMYWKLTHMIAPREFALQCTDCHSDNGRLDWNALGYTDDPAFSGGRMFRRFVKSGEEKM